MEKEENPGRKLGFISQEIGREINTIGSEASKVGIWPGLFGSFGIGLGVLVIAVPLERPDLAPAKGDVRFMLSLMARLLPWSFTQ